MDVASTSDASTVARLSTKAQVPSWSEEANSFKTFARAYRYWLPPALVSVALSFLFLNPFIGDWDGLDYTVFSLRGVPSSMALGRSLFTLFNHELYVIAHAIFGVQPEQAYLLFKYAVVAQSPLTIIVCWILARDLTGSIRSATIASLLVAFSPMFVIYSGQVMTDVPSVLVSVTALVIHLRGVQQRRVWLTLVGAALLGLGVNVRETVGLFLPWLVIAPFVGGWKLDRRSIAVVMFLIVTFFVCAFGIFAFWFANDPAYRATWHVWLSSMQDESARHPVGIANVRPFLIYFFMAAPLAFVALPWAAWKEWRARGWSLLLSAACVGLFANAMLFFNYSTTINWRYFLTGVPLLAPMVGDYFVRSQTEKLNNARRGFVTAVAGVVLVAGLMGLLVRPASSEYFNHLALAKDYNARLQLMPRDAVVIAGAETVAVTYWRGIGAGQWDHIGVGAGWPDGRLEAKIAEYLKSGRRVFLDTDPRWWQPCSWHVKEIVELAKIDSRFHFVRVAPTIYEIRPAEDASANDQPHLEMLLPENRPEEVKKCFSAE
ncbi:MAG TPA: glycosyltransferase family 39 protein [Pyrinomonadaceae bacterium]|nr:glycosyltransferase family 39 protein [Pyrinomonadaceae bacterium]